MDNFSVRKLANLAGVSVRTLHLYDKTGLLKPSVRTQAGYRLYGVKELLRLQQILFYRELDFPLREIGNILDDPAFDLELALVAHKNALLARKERINTLVGTIEKTLATIKNKSMLQAEELYDGISKEKLNACRADAISRWGETTIVETENVLSGFNNEAMNSIKTELQEINQQLSALMNTEHSGNQVQQCIARRYQIILQLTGGKVNNGKMEYLRKLSEIYKEGNHQQTVESLPDKELAVFIQKATIHYLSNH